jgi:hypothetical protein
VRRPLSKHHPLSLGTLLFLSQLLGLKPSHRSQNMTTFIRAFKTLLEQTTVSQQVSLEAS